MQNVFFRDINQYDISDPENPKHVGRVWIGGSIQKSSGVTVTEGELDICTGCASWLRPLLISPSMHMEACKMLLSIARNKLLTICAGSPFHGIFLPCSAVLRRRVHG